MSEQRLVLTDSADGRHEGDFEKRLAGARVRRATLRGGVREGVDTIEIDNGRSRIPYGMIAAAGRPAGRRSARRAPPASAA